MMARRGSPSQLAVKASWPPGWESGGVLAPGGVRPEEVALVCADLARSRALSTTVRPGFSAAPAWSEVARGTSTITRAVHVAHFGESFEDFWARSVSAKTRSNIRASRRHMEKAGIVITSGNSPELVRAFYYTYLQWIDWRARQRKVPAFLRPGGRPGGLSHSRSSRPWPALWARTAGSGCPGGRACGRCDNLPLHP